MLKKIPIDQLALGMHVHALDGAWLDHPFWKTQFVLRDPQDLARLRASGISACWIDAARGLDVASQAGSALRASPAATETVDGLVDRAPPRRSTVSLDEERVRAVALCRAGKQAVQSLFEDVRMGRALDTDRCWPLVDDIVASVDRNAGALISVVRLKSHDEYTFLHSVAVCALMVALARRLGLEAAQVRDAGVAGLLHDVGKAMIPVHVLNKPGRLSDVELQLVKTHPLRGYQLLSEGHRASAVTLDVCLHHHERPDGKGYPDAGAAGTLSLHARMGAVCDVYDAITSSRPYKARWDPADSIARMAEWCKEGQFDAAMFAALVHCLGIYPVGSLVRLRSGRLAVVTEQNPSTLWAPQVRVFFSTKSAMPAPVELVDLSRTGCGETIIARESNAQWGFPHLDQLAASSC